MNKFYIQIALFLLSIFAYANNEAFADEPAPGEDAKPQLRSRYPTPEKVYEQNKHLLRTDPNEINNAEKLMNKAVKQLEYHATSKDGYEPYVQNHGDGISYYIKKFDDQTNIIKVHLNIYAANQYNAIINRLWDPDSPNIFNNGDVKIFRVYNPNLILVQQRFKKKLGRPQKYFNALIGKSEISEGKTIIAMTSSNTTNKNHSNIIHKNPILKNTYSFTTPTYSKYYDNSCESAQVFVNLAGYFIEKKGDDLEITYIESIEGHSSI
ncbi:fam-a protein [Plasmodium vinckei brucechwatti]|uniref:Fam-a protein n=1 Tax=Plasmodium vinckei brucechwatti TaxID=119398 RepID=A0A6V7SF15_PLAVN|nr:fam-a protein [Plasmodium vinckei brucechwatti]